MLQIADYIARNYSGKVVEIGIGYYWKVAKELKRRGFEVVVTDRKPIPVSDLKFHIDDVTQPDLRIYRGASLIYSIRPPPELVTYILRVSKSVGADCLIRPFGNEFFNGKLVNYRGERFYVWKVVV